MLAILILTLRESPALRMPYCLAQLRASHRCLTTRALDQQQLSGAGPCLEDLSSCQQNLLRCQQAWFQR